MGTLAQNNIRICSAYVVGATGTASFAAGGGYTVYPEGNATVAGVVTSFAVLRIGTGQYRVTFPRRLERNEHEITLQLVGAGGANFTRTLSGGQTATQFTQINITTFISGAPQDVDFILSVAKIRQYGAAELTGLAPAVGAPIVAIPTAPTSWSTVFGPLLLADFPVGGAIGTAAATVDLASHIAIPQTTVGQTVTVPAPTLVTQGRMLVITNTGTVSVTVLAAPLLNGNSLLANWNGTAWVIIAMNAAGAPFGLAWLQGGNAFAALGTIGLTDANAMRFLTNNIEAMRILSSPGTAASPTGNVGIGTAVPAALLDVLSTSNSGTITTGQFRRTGAPSGAINRMTLSIASPDSIRNDIAFGGSFFLANDTAANGTRNFALIDQVAARNRWLCDVNGNVGFGSVAGTPAVPGAPATAIDVGSSVAATFAMTVRNTNNIAGANTLQVSGGQDVWSAASSLINFIRPDTTQVGVIQQVASGAIAYVTTSDRRVKSNIRMTQRGLELVRQMRVRDFCFEGSEKVIQGFIAQEMADIYPDAVSVGGENPRTSPWGVDYGRLTPVLCRAIQDQQALIEKLESRLQNLELGARN